MFYSKQWTRWAVSLASLPFLSVISKVLLPGGPAALEVLKEDLRALNLWSVKQMSLVFIKVYALLVFIIGSLPSPSLLVFLSPRGPLLSVFSSSIDVQMRPHSQLA